MSVGPQLLSLRFHHGARAVVLQGRRCFGSRAGYRPPGTGRPKQSPPPSASRITDGRFAESVDPRERVEPPYARWNRDRIARLPGSIHPQSGKRAGVVSFSAATHDPDQLSFLLDEVPAAAARTDTTSDEALSFEAVKWPGHPALSDVLWEYIERRPRRGQYGYDRSNVEMGIFTALVHQGWTDEEIIGFANVYLPRHRQDFARFKDFRWTLRSLEKARVRATEISSSSTSPAGSPPPTTTGTGTSINTSSRMCKKVIRIAMLIEGKRSDSSRVSQPRN